jgi:hypothetical protein
MTDLDDTRRMVRRYFAAVRGDPEPAEGRHPWSLCAPPSPAMPRSDRA